MSSGLVELELLKGEGEFVTFEALESAGMLSILDEDEQETFQLLKRNKLIQQPIIENHEGEILGYKNHQILAKFNSAFDAVQCADAILRICQNEPELKLKIGIHLGEFSFNDGEVSGDDLEVVSTLEVAAPIGCILVSEPVHTNILNRQGIVSSLFEIKNAPKLKRGFKAFQIAVMGKNQMIKKRSPFRRGLDSIKGLGKSKTLIAITVLLAVSYLVYSNYSNNQSFTPSIVTVDKSIVVLPFVNTSNDPEQEYFSDGMTDEIINHLAGIEDLKVISRTTTMQYKGTAKSVREITKELGVATALEGSIRKDSDQIRITVQLIEGDTDTQLWSESYDRHLTNIFEVQSDVAKQIAQVLQAEISPKVLLRIEPQPAKSLEAYMLLLEANYISRKPRSDEKQRDLMEKAVKLDSTNSKIWSGLARAYSRWGSDFTTRIERALKAKEAAEKAILLDPEDAMGHVQLGSILRTFYWDWKNAEIEFKKAEELNSEFAGSLISLYQSLGQWDKSVSASKHLLENEPINPNRWWIVGANYLYAGIPNEAVYYLLKALELDANYDQVKIDLGWAYLELNQPKKAMEVLDLVSNKKGGRFISYIIYAYYQMGRMLEVNSYLEQLLEKDGVVDNSVYLARSYALLNEADLSFEWLQKAYERKNPALCLIKSAQFNHVQNLNDPRYFELLRKMNLPVN